jgi:hypothetical protein
VEVKSQFKMYGNMSSIEKAMNKHDMQAYKNYDANQYSLVPGLQHAKHHESPALAAKITKPTGQAPPDSPKVTGVLGNAD